MSAREACIIDPMWDQFIALLPPHEDTHPLGGHRPRVADRVVFDTLVQVLFFGCAYARIAAKTCSATTVRRRRDAWIAAGVMAILHTLVLAVDDRMIGRELTDLAVDDCMTTAPCGGEVAGRSPVNRGDQGRTPSLVVDATGIPLGSIAAPASQPDSPLLEATLDTLARRGPLPEGITVHLDRGYDSALTRQRLVARGLQGEIAVRGTPPPSRRAGAGWWSARMPGPIAARNWSGARNGGLRWWRFGSPWPQSSSSSVGSSATGGPAPAGRDDHLGNRDRAPYWRRL